MTVNTDATTDPLTRLWDETRRAVAESYTRDECKELIDAPDWPAGDGVHGNAISQLMLTARIINTDENAAKRLCGAVLALAIETRAMISDEHFDCRLFDRQINGELVLSVICDPRA